MNQSTKSGTPSARAIEAIQGATSDSQVLAAVEEFAGAIANFRDAQLNGVREQFMPVGWGYSRVGLFHDEDIADEDIFFMPLGTIGGTEEGILRAHRRRLDGSLRDSVLFSIIASEWPATREALQRRLAR